MLADDDGGLKADRTGECLYFAPRYGSIESEAVLNWGKWGLHDDWHIVYGCM